MFFEGYAFPMLFRDFLEEYKSQEKTAKIIG